MLTRVLAVTLLAGVATDAAAHQGWGIVVRPDGTIYMADIPTNTIWRVTPAGDLQVAVADKHSHALIGTDDGAIWGTHEHGPRRPGEVWKLSADGNVTTVVMASSSFEMSLHSFLLAPDATVYSTNLYAGPNGPHRLLRRSSAGEVSVAVAGARGIDGLAFGPDGSIYYTDADALRRLLMDGTVATVAEGLTEPAWGEDLMGLVVDAAANTYVADYSQNQILHVNRDGAATKIFESRWPWSPTGVARDDSAVYVLEHLRMPYVLLGNIGVGPYIRVLRVAADGTSEKRAVVWG